jgi:hypothetical protein
LVRAEYAAPPPQFVPKAGALFISSPASWPTKPQ